MLTDFFRLRSTEVAEMITTNCIHQQSNSRGLKLNETVNGMTERPNPFADEVMRVNETLVAPFACAQRVPAHAELRHMMP